MEKRRQYKKNRDAQLLEFMRRNDIPATDVLISLKHDYIEMQKWNRETPNVPMCPNLDNEYKEKIDKIDNILYDRYDEEGGR